MIKQYRIVKKYERDLEEGKIFEIYQVQYIALDLLKTIFFGWISWEKWYKWKPAQRKRRGWGVDEWMEDCNFSTIQGAEEYVENLKKPVHEEEIFSLHEVAYFNEDYDL